MVHVVEVDDADRLLHEPADNVRTPKVIVAHALDEQREDLVGVGGPEADPHRRLRPQLKIDEERPFKAGGVVNAGNLAVRQPSLGGAVARPPDAAEVRCGELEAAHPLPALLLLPNQWVLGEDKRANNFVGAAEPLLPLYGWVEGGAVPPQRLFQQLSAREKGEADKRIKRLVQRADVNTARLQSVHCLIRHHSLQPREG